MLTHQIARTCVVLLLLAIAFGLSLLPGDNAEAQEDIDVAGHWIFSRDGAPGCLVWIEREGDVLSGAISCAGFNLGKDLVGVVADDGSFSFLNNFGSVTISFVGSVDDEFRRLVGEWTIDTLSGKYHYSGTFTASPDLAGWGNLNCDATVSSLDALLVLQAYYRTPCYGQAGLIRFEAPNVRSNGGDVNLDGRKDSEDALLILQVEAGLLERLPIR